MISVTLETVTEMPDTYGNVSESVSSTTYDRVQFAPRSSTERADPRVPAVITGATLYRRGDFPVFAADRIVIADQSPMIDGTWQVDGEAGYWGRGVEVAIKRAES